MSKKTNQQKKDQEIQAKSQEILAKIQAERAAGTLAPAEDKRENIVEAKKKLAESYNKLTEMEARRNKLAKKAKLAEGCTYPVEERRRILQNCKAATGRYMKLKEVFERHEQEQEFKKMMEVIREHAAKVKAESADTEEE